MSTLIAFNDGFGAITRPGELTTFSANPNLVMKSLQARLSRMGVTHAYAGYWVANDLTFISDNRITALALGEDRNPPGAGNVGSHPAWIFVPADSVAIDSAQLGSVTNLEPGSISEEQLVAWVNAHGIPYRFVSTGNFDIILPSQKVEPSEIVG